MFNSFFNSSFATFWFRVVEEHHYNEKTRKILFDQELLNELNNGIYHYFHFRQYLLRQSVLNDYFFYLIFYFITYKYCMPSLLIIIIESH